MNARQIMRESELMGDEKDWEEYDLFASANDQLYRTLEEES